MAPYPERWKPEHPCRPEVENVVRFLVESILAAELDPVTFQDEEDPDLFSIGVEDEKGYFNMGLVGWSDEREKIVYAGFKPEVAAHDEAEGVPEDESKCWWVPNSADMMRRFLMGEIREIVAKYRAQEWRVLDGGTQKDLNEEAA